MVVDARGDVSHDRLPSQDGMARQIGPEPLRMSQDQPGVALMEVGEGAEDNKIAITNHQGSTAWSAWSVYDVAMRVHGWVQGSNGTSNTHVASDGLSRYGYEPCPWMALPPDERYPRMPSSNQDSINKQMDACMKQLGAKQEKGDLIFLLCQGQGLAAEVSGSFHGGTDDGDIDLKMIIGDDGSFSRHDLDSHGMPQLCSSHGIHFGSYGTWRVGELQPATPGSGWSQPASARDVFTEAIQSPQDSVFFFLASPMPASRSTRGQRF